MALFAEFGMEPRGDGILFRAINNKNPKRVKEDTAKKLLRMKSDKFLNFEPDLHDTFLEEKSENNGTSVSSDVPKVRSAFKNTGYVFAPITSPTPNCVTWFDNVLYNLNVRRIVSFNNDFVVPIRKEPLQGGRRAGSSASQGAKVTMRVPGRFHTCDAGSLCPFSLTLMANYLRLWYCYIQRH